MISLKKGDSLAHPLSPLQQALCWDPGTASLAKSFLAFQPAPSEQIVSSERKWLHYWDDLDGPLAPRSSSPVIYQGFVTWEGGDGMVGTALAAQVGGPLKSTWRQTW